MDSDPKAATTRRMSNPLFNEERWNNAERAGDEIMTINGAIKKTGFLMLILILTFGATWDSLSRTHLVFGMALGPAILVAAITGVVLVLIAMFAPRTTAVTGTLYALAEGLVLGAISWIYNEKFHGLPILAAALTIGTLVGMLFLYTNRILQATPMFTKVIVGATAGLALGIGLLFILNLFSVGQGLTGALYGSGWIGIGFSVVCVGLAAFNLIVDFGFIESAAQAKAPKYMEWVGALGLVITLVWLYLEILRLLAKLQSNR